MFGRKVKYKKYSAEWYMELFNEFTNESISRKVNRELYDRIYEYYSNKVKNNTLDIKIERITIERKIGKYKGFGTNFNMQFLIIPFTAFLSGLIQLSGTTVPTKYSAVMSFVVAALMFVYIMSQIDKDKVVEKEFVYHISLKVLDDIEKEIKDEQEKFLKQSEKIEITEKSKSSVISDVVLPALLEIAATSVIKRFGKKDN